MALREDRPRGAGEPQGERGARPGVAVLGALWLVASVAGATMETRRLASLEAWQHRGATDAAHWREAGDLRALELGAVRVAPGARVRVTVCAEGWRAVTVRVRSAEGVVSTAALRALPAPPSGCAETSAHVPPGVAAAWLERAAVSPPRVRSADLRAEGALSPWSFAPLFALLLGVALAVRAGARGPDAESALPSTGLRVSAGGCLGALVGSQLLGYVVAAASGPGASGLLASVFAQHAVLLVASAALLRVGGAGRAQWLPGFGSVSPRARVELTALAGALLLAAWAVSRGLGDVSESPLAAALEVVSNRYVIAYTALLAPLAEELFFRGALQASLGRERPAAGVVASGAVFTALHAQQLQGAWLGLVPIALLALANGWLRLRTRGLTAPWLVHTLYNGALVLSVLRG